MDSGLQLMKKIALKDGRVEVQDKRKMRETLFVLQRIVEKGIRKLGGGGTELGEPENLTKQTTKNKQATIK